MKEFLSIVIVLICGCIAFGIFSSVGSATDSQQVAPITSPTVQQLACFGPVTIDPATQANVPVSCGNQNAPYVKADNNVNCPANSLLIGMTYATSSCVVSEDCCNFWGDDCDCWGTCYGCQFVCAKTTSEKQNCTWSTHNIQ
jgi:hypothetical protein